MMKDKVRFVLDQPASQDIYSDSSLKQLVAQLGHMHYPNPSQSVFALSTKFCVLSGEATNANFIVFGKTRQGLAPTNCGGEAGWSRTKRTLS
jgi:hypothetical protein